MGTQQLLLIVLGVIIVGIAIVVGIQMFGASAVEANKNAIVQDALQVAAKAQQWYRKPEVLGGGGRKFTGFDLTKIGFDSPGTNEATADSTENGKIWLTVSSDHIIIHVRGKEQGADGNLIELQDTVYADRVSSPYWVHQ